MRGALLPLVGFACASLPPAEPAPFEKRSSPTLAATVVDDVDPYTHRDEVARRMRRQRFCARARDTYAPCSRGTSAEVRFSYRQDRVVAIEILVPADAFPRHRRALETRFGTPTAEEPDYAAWRLARNWRIRLERRRSVARELHSYVP